MSKLIDNLIKKYEYNIYINENISVEKLDKLALLLEKEENIRISNVVFMGIGEPLDNFENVVNALMIINDPFRIKYWCKTYQYINMWNS